METTLKATRIQLKRNIFLNNNYDGNPKERKQIYDLLHRTLEFGESNSALLIGPRGSGKTKLVNNVLSELEELPHFKNNCVIVYLNGFLHTDDKLALVSITTQMNLDNVVGEKVFGSFAENLAFLLACLRTGNKRTSISVLFIIEEFDLFCSHTNQTLLYNLFDVSQSAQAPICVLGVTCRMDVIELLEKRVKSRFSHRQYFLFPGTENGDELNFYSERLKNMLTLHKDESLNTKYINEWNDRIKKLIKDKKFRTIIQRCLDISLNENVLKNMVISVVTKLNNENPFITCDDFEAELELFEKDDVTEQLLDLSVLEICLLISMKHHCEIYDNQPMNFEMIFTRYAKFANSSSNIQNVQRPIVMKAYEHLINMELIQPITAGAQHNRAQKEYEMFRFLVTKQQIMDAVKRFPGLPTDVAQWAISSLI